jgi:hypothetical protein
MGTPTFWLEPIDRVRLGLRRYARRSGSAAWTCADGWHNALVWTGTEIDAEYDERGYLKPIAESPHDDPLWPAECDRGCGYRFTPDDNWQAWSEQLYRRVDTGELRVLHIYHPPDVPTAEPGAMWNAWWLESFGRGPDGICLMVRCPRPDGSPGTARDWSVDGPSSSGGHWTRTGDPRQANVTVSPSIAIGDPGEPGHYHGFLQSGVLTDHVG